MLGGFFERIVFYENYFFKKLNSTEIVTCIVCSYRFTKYGVQFFGVHCKPRILYMLNPYSTLYNMSSVCPRALLWWRERTERWNRDGVAFFLLFGFKVATECLERNNRCPLRQCEPCSMFLDCVTKYCRMWTILSNNYEKLLHFGRCWNWWAP